MKSKFSMVIECPGCGENALMTELLKKIPKFGKILITNIHCNNCSFNLNDVLGAEEKKPKRFEAKISSPKDLSTKIVKSSTSSVEIPELGISIQSSPYSEGYYTNIEGLLERIHESISSMVQFTEITEKEKEKIEELKKKIEKARNSEIEFTVILEDLAGNGALIGKKVKEKNLSN